MQPSTDWHAAGMDAVTVAPVHTNMPGGTQQLNVQATLNGYNITKKSKCSLKKPIYVLVRIGLVEFFFLHENRKRQQGYYEDQVTHSSVAQSGGFLLYASLERFVGLKTAEEAQASRRSSSASSGISSLSSTS